MRVKFEDIKVGDCIWGPAAIYGENEIVVRACYVTKKDVDSCRYASDYSVIDASDKAFEEYSYFSTAEECIANCKTIHEHGRVREAMWFRQRADRIQTEAEQVKNWPTKIVDAGPPKMTLGLTK